MPKAYHHCMPWQCQDVGRQGWLWHISVNVYGKSLRGLLWSSIRSGLTDPGGIHIIIPHLTQYYPVWLQAVQLCPIPAWLDSFTLLCILSILTKFTIKHYQVPCWSPDTWDLLHFFSLENQSLSWEKDMSLTWCNFGKFLLTFSFHFPFNPIFNSPITHKGSVRMLRWD